MSNLTLNTERLMPMYAPHVTDPKREIGSFVVPSQEALEIPVEERLSLSAVRLLSEFSFSVLAKAFANSLSKRLNLDTTTVAHHTVNLQDRLSQTASKRELLLFLQNCLLGEEAQEAYSEAQASQEGLSRKSFDKTTTRRVKAGKFFARFPRIENPRTVKLPPPNEKVSYANLSTPDEHFGRVIMTKRLRLALQELGCKTIYVPREFVVQVSKKPDRYLVLSERVSLLSPAASARYIQLLPKAMQRQLAKEICDIIEATALIFTNKDSLRIGKRTDPDENTRYYFVIYNTCPKGAFTMGKPAPQIEAHVLKVRRSYLALDAILQCPSAVQNTTFAKQVAERSRTWFGRYGSWRFLNTEEQSKLLKLELRVRNLGDPSALPESDFDQITGFKYSPTDLVAMHKKARETKKKQENAAASGEEK